MMKSLWCFRRRTVLLLILLYCSISAAAAAFAGGGFGASSKKKKVSAAPIKKQQRKRKTQGGGFASDAVVSFTETASKKEVNKEEVQLDKWGLPPPTIHDIFPPTDPADLIAARSGSNEYTLPEIHRALENSIPLDLSRFTKDQPKFGDMQLQLLHVSPPVLAINNFLTPLECAEIDRVAALGSQKNGKEDEEDIAITAQELDTITEELCVRVESATASPLAQSARTSTSWFCHYKAVPTLLAKMQHVLGLSLQHMEEPQIVRYQAGQEFTWHCDAVPDAQLDNGGQRLATLLVYLTTVVPQGSGGATVFRDLRDAHGNVLAVQPVRGAALLFFPADQDGAPDDRTLHKGEMVRGDDANEKRIAQVWIHQSAYRAAVPPNNRQEDAVGVVRAASRRLGYTADDC